MLQFSSEKTSLLIGFGSYEFLRSEPPFSVVFDNQAVLPSNTLAYQVIAAPYGTVGKGSYQAGFLPIPAVLDVLV